MKAPSFLPNKYDSYDALMLRNTAIEHELNYLTLFMDEDDTAVYH